MGPTHNKWVTWWDKLSSITKLTEKSKQKVKYPREKNIQSSKGQLVKDTLERVS